MMSGRSIAVGVPVYTRGRALEQFLESVPACVSTAYVAENGPEDDRDRDAYARDWPFSLEVLHLNHDVGIGACRAAITEALAEPYLWVGDCDMAFTADRDLRTLRSILERNPELGGVAGWLLEGDTVRSGARDIVVESGTIIKNGSDPCINREGVPFARYEFIPQAALFRAEVFDTHDYEPRARTSEHVDFFYGHKQAGEWSFASTPAVLVEHNRDINEEYREEVRDGYNLEVDVLEDKYGLTGTAPGKPSDWAKLRDRSIGEQCFDVFRATTPPKVWLPIKRVLEGMLR